MSNAESINHIDRHVWGLLIIVLNHSYLIWEVICYYIWLVMDLSHSIIAFVVAIPRVTRVGYNVRGTSNKLNDDGNKTTIKVKQTCLTMSTNTHILRAIMFTSFNLIHLCSRIYWLSLSQFGFWNSLFTCSTFL